MTIIAPTYNHGGMSDLKTWRETRKMSQAEFAKLVDTSQPHISAIEKADENGSLELAIKIFNVTGLCVGRLKNATPKQARTIAQVAA